MTVTVTSNRVEFAGNDIATAFPFTFKTYDPADIVCSKFSSVGIETPLVKDVSYSVALNANGTGTVTYPISGSPLATGETLLVRRVVPNTQVVNLAPNGPYDPTSTMHGMDENTFKAIQNAEEIGRALRVPANESALAVLPTAATRANKALGFDANGNISLGADFSDLTPLTLDSVNGYVGINAVPDSPLVAVSPDSAGAHLTPAASTVATFKRRASGGAFISLITDTAEPSGINFGQTSDENDGVLEYDHFLNQFNFKTSTVTRMSVKLGLIVGSPTGGDKGAGAINAEAVYDDNVLLTCYVADAALDGSIDLAAWDARVPDREFQEKTRDTGVLDKRGDPVLEVTPAYTEERNHDPAARFESRMGRDLDPELFYADFAARRALPAMPTRQEWATQGPLSSGETIQRLWETIESMVVHDKKQGDLITALESRLAALEGA